VALSTYITQVRRLLHDLNGQYWSDSELTDYINEARNRVCKDSRCLRQQIVNLVTLQQGVEQYTLASIEASSQFTTLYSGYTIIDVMGINILWGSTRIKLAYLPWTRFDVQFRYWNNMQSRPVCFSRLGSLSVYMGPQPDTTYQSDWDLALIPPVLTSDSTPEPIPEPFTTPIKYYAAHLAKFREQALGESELFNKMYVAKLRQEATAFMGRIIPDPYAK
jgi:hypothetical protein